MKTTQFHKFLINIANLNTLQYRELKEKINQIDSIKHVSNTIETDYSEISCPHCDSKKILRWGKRNDMQRYKCKECNKTFNSLTGTPLAHLHKKGRWLNYSKCLKNGLSIRRSAQECGINITTSFRWRHRFLINTNSIKPEKLQGIVESETLLMKFSTKGSHKSNNTVQHKKHVSVIFTRDRSSNTTDHIFMNLNVNNIMNAVGNVISKDSLFCSDNKPIYNKYIDKARIRHGCLDLCKGLTVKNDIIHINNVLRYKFNFLSWMKRFRGVATKYLTNYLGWHRGIDEFSYELNSKTILMRAKQAENTIPTIIDNTIITTI